MYKLRLTSQSYHLRPTVTKMLWWAFQDPLGLKVMRRLAIRKQEFITCPQMSFR